MELLKLFMTNNTKEEETDNPSQQNMTSIVSGGSFFWYSLSFSNLSKNVHKQKHDKGKQEIFLCLPRIFLTILIIWVYLFAV